jgi:hypothetical protein
MAVASPVTVFLAGVAMSTELDQHNDTPYSTLSSTHVPAVVSVVPVGLTP